MVRSRACERRSWRGHVAKSTTTCLSPLQIHRQWSDSWIRTHRRRASGDGPAPCVRLSNPASGPMRPRAPGCSTQAGTRTTATSTRAKPNARAPDTSGLVRSRPGCRQDNGGHERMHADVSGDVQSHPGATVDAEQRRLSRWRQESNQVCPHQALGGKVPAVVYKVIEPRRPVPLPSMYHAHMYVTQVYSNGSFRFRNDELPLGEVFAGYEVGVVDALRVRVWFRDVDLGLVETLPDVDVSCVEDAARSAGPAPQPDRMQGSRANAAGDGSRFAEASLSRSQPAS